MAESNRSGEVEVLGVTKRFGETVAIQDLSLTIPHGSYCCLLGPSGCGKTTILRMIAGHETPTTGDVRIGGESVIGLPQVRRGTAMMFQSYALFPHRSVLDNVAFALKMRGAGLAERHAKARELITKVQLEKFADRLPAQLSGGQQQRVALARALITNPRVLLLDEPLGALDLKLRQQMQLELKGIQRDLSERITFLYVTHDQDEALTMSDRIAVFRDGRLEQLGTPGEIYEHPANEFVAGFVGTSNVIERDGRRCTVRPEKIRMLEEGAQDAGAVPGVVREVSYLGPTTRYLVELGGGETLVVVRQNLDTSAAEVLQQRGRRVRLSWRSEDLKELDSIPQSEEHIA